MPLLLSQLVPPHTMCYSAQSEASYQRYGRAFGADIDIATFVRLYVDRAHGSGAKIPKGMDAAFLAPASTGARDQGAGRRA